MCISINRSIGRRPTVSAAPKMLDDEHLLRAQLGIEDESFESNDYASTIHFALSLTAAWLALQPQACRILSIQLEFQHRVAPQCL